MYVSVHACVYVCVHYLCVCVHERVSECVCVHERVSECVCVCVCLHVHVREHIYDNNYVYSV